MSSCEARPSILIVDDEARIRELLADILERQGYIAETAEDGPSALMCLRERAYDCCIFDIAMPHMSGFDLLEISALEYPDCPIILLTGESTLGNAVEAIRRGAYDFLTKPVDVELVQIAVDRALEQRRLVLETQRYRESLENQVREKTRELAIRNRQLASYAKELEDVTINLISSLLVAMEAKDPYTAGHSVRVRQYCRQIGKKMALSPEDLRVLERAAALHDIGKLIVENAAMSKPGPLSDVEWEFVLRHPEVGDRMLAPFSFLQRERAHIRHHHERFDGNGYPDGIAGGQIPVLTEILSVADTYDAMTSKRSYRRQAKVDDACDELLRSIGSQFSDRVVPVFVQILKSGEMPIIPAPAIPEIDAPLRPPRREGPHADGPAHRAHRPEAEV